jgi:hypothetical protein
MKSEDRKHLVELLHNHRSRLRALEKKAAIYGLNVPPEVSIEIEQIRDQILQIEATLAVQRSLVDRRTLGQIRQQAQKAYFIKDWAMLLIC